MEGLPLDSVGIRAEFFVYMQLLTNPQWQQRSEPLYK